MEIQNHPDHYNRSEEMLKLKKIVKNELILSVAPYNKFISFDKSTFYKRFKGCFIIFIHSYCPTLNGSNENC